MPRTAAASLIGLCFLSAALNYGLNVATRADQLALDPRVKVPVYDPVEITSIDSFAAGEVDVSFWSKVYPLPTDCVPE